VAIYNIEDIKVEEVDGDLTVENGDLVLASVQDSVKQYLLTWTLTTRGGFSFDPTVGWGAEGFVGRKNVPSTHEAMEKDIGFSYNVAEDLSPEDLTYRVSYINPDVAALTVVFNGMIIESDGTSPTSNIVLTFSFPFYSGQVQQEVQV